ncbi:MAG: GNAT family N-acetyltransferase [Christensenellaceae bacterium]|nr:GNAT family N-acetyltransferase [Christensenellaceae bacterium]
MEIQIRKVEKDSELMQRLLHFVENFSWHEVREHTLQQIENWEYEDWESPFIAMDGEKIIGMATLMKTDYYPLPEIYPWVSTIFVAEEYRGQRISGKLIDFVNAYAKELGFNRTYIPTEYIGLYEKFGYSYLKDIVNYGGDTDRLYAKEI